MNDVRRSACKLVLGLLAPIGFCSCSAHLPAAQPLTPVAVTERPAAHPRTATAAARLVTASWYGPGLAGHRTTSGEIFNPRHLTAASKTLPMGSVVKITNPGNGNSVNVRINDRGPFVPGRALDLSRHAAERLGILHKGVAAVRMSVRSTPQASSASTPRHP